MDTRRDFIKKAALLTGAAELCGVLPASIRQALAIDPEPGSTYLDAEHVVILMQENRSFDHCYGTLQGVRGFNDPRAISLPNENPVWLQSSASGQTYAPFRLQFKETKSTWMGSLPHSWPDQVDARNFGKYDRWLEAKPSGHRQYSQMPLTLGYYSREDLPFYYAFADAFTVCDQHFCSSLTGTTPNRLFLWTGTIREKQNANSPAMVQNSDVDYGSTARWSTFPEQLEASGVSWKIYQNEVSLDTGLKGEAEAWLANFTDNPLEWFEQYHIQFADGYRDYLDRSIQPLAEELQALEKEAAALPANSPRLPGIKRRIQEKTNTLQPLQNLRAKVSLENFARLPQREQNLHRKAFCTNRGDPAYRQLVSLRYRDGAIERTVQIPKGDILHQFREDVNNSKLPAVSWLVAPANFSDHPGSAWYGAWYVSEVLDILTRKPDVWKKTIFLLTYDENDGFFDHVPPFVPPHPRQAGTGLVSKGIDPSVEYVELEQDLRRRSASDARESSIGLGYRVPLVIASPWSRGGRVCSQVFDHTSVLQLLERLLSQRSGKKIEESNISAWRRTVCGDLTSAFKPDNGAKWEGPTPPAKEAFIQQVHQAQFKGVPSNYRPLSRAEIEAARRDPRSSALLPQQEPGIRPSCALPYQLSVNGRLSSDSKRFEITFEARTEFFGDRSAGAPFHVYAPGNHRPRQSKSRWERSRNWAYAVAAGDRLSDGWILDDFENSVYHLRVYGPNGFYREFTGDASDPLLEVECGDQRGPNPAAGLTGNLEIRLSNLARDQRSWTVAISDNAYKTSPQTKVLPPGAREVLLLDLGKSHGWYDFSIRAEGSKAFLRRYAGHVETGRESFSDPHMGRV